MVVVVVVFVFVLCAVCGCHGVTVRLVAYGCVGVCVRERESVGCCWWCGCCVCCVIALGVSLCGCMVVCAMLDDIGSPLLLLCIVVVRCCVRRLIVVGCM